MSNIYLVEAGVSREELEAFVTEKDPNGRVLDKEEIADQIDEVIAKIGVDLNDLVSNSDSDDADVDNSDDDAA